VLHKYSGAGRDVRQARRALQLKLRELRFPIRLAHRLGRRRDFGDARQRFTGQQTQPFRYNNVTITWASLDFGTGNAVGAPTAHLPSLRRSAR
jgi:hypothetical protein